MQFGLSQPHCRLEGLVKAAELNWEKLIAADAGVAPPGVPGFLYFVVAYAAEACEILVRSGTAEFARDAQLPNKRQCFGAGFFKIHGTAATGKSAEDLDAVAIPGDEEAIEAVVKNNIWVGSLV